MWNLRRLHETICGSVKIVIVSDTHQRHEEFERLEGDVLIHCGDMFDLFGDAETDIADIDRWFGEQDFDLVLCTGGNHDIALESAVRSNPQPFRNAVYLQDDTYVHNDRVFWGAPWVPDLPHHAFHATRKELAASWLAIPPEVDVLITHTPPMSILDQSSTGFELGCSSLLEAVYRTGPAVHCFGHVHYSRGQMDHLGTTFVNASSIQRGQSGVLEPVVIEL